MKQFLAFVTILCPLATASAETNQPAKVPFEILKTKHLAVKIKVNGKGPYRVIFDTGAPVNLLNNKIAKEAKLTGKGLGGGLPLFGMQGEMTVKRLEMGSLTADDIPVIVMDHPALGAVSRVLGPVDGIIGFPFFARYRMTLDYQSQTLGFVPVAYRAGNVMDSMMVMLMDRSQKPAKKVLPVSTVWGLVVEKEKGDDAPGVDVKQVLPGGAAEAAGMKAGDRLVVLDGTWTDSVADCQRAASGVQAGQAVRVRLKRQDKELEIVIAPRAGI